MTMSFTIAHTADLVSLSQFVNKAYRGATARLGWTHEADLLDGTRVDASLLSEQMDRGVLLVLVHSDDQLVGCYHFEMKDPQTAYVGMITVEPSRQGQGLGKKLLENAFSRARHEGAQKITLTVMSDRSELIAYYGRRGFQLTGQQYPFDATDDRYGLPKKQLVLLEMACPL